MVGCSDFNCCLEGFADRRAQWDHLVGVDDQCDPAVSQNSGCSNSRNLLVVLLKPLNDNFPLVENLIDCEGHSAPGIGFENKASVMEVFAPLAEGKA